jgi:hypothetical protein
MEAVLRNLKQVTAVARSSDAGELLESAGQFDTDTFSAVAAVAAPALRDIGELLGVGRLERWALVTEQQSYYVSERGTERVLAVGDPVKAPDATSKQLHSAK